MKNAEDVPVKRLVVDSGAFIKRAQLQDLATEILTTSGVISELKCSKSRHLLESLPFEITVQEPTPESLHIISEFSKKTGDYSSLSVIDLKVLALVHDLHVEEYGSDDLKYEIAKQKEGDTHSCVISEKAVPYVNISTRVESENDLQEDEIDDNNENDEDDGTWIGEDNLEQELGRLGEVILPNEYMKVACITTDYSIQNVLLHMGLHLLSLGGYRIRKLNSYVLRCRACFATTAVMTRQFCPRCGHGLLHRVGVVVNEDGSTELQVNWKRLNSSRGLRYSLPAPKGGKHDTGPQLFEDQRMPQNRLARLRSDPLQAGPFSVNDVTSRSAVLGIRSLQKEMSRGGRRSNQSTHGRKRGSKKR